MDNIGILGVGSCKPEYTMTNDELATIVDTSDEWITSRTGIKERRISKDKNTSVLAAKAAEEALKVANIKAEEIDLIIVATITPDCFFPSTACLVQAEIGASNAVCYDISAACSGFVYAVSTAYQFLKNKVYKNAIVIGAETLSKIADWDDRSTCVLFGDGAGAVVLGAKEKSGILSSYMGSDGFKGKSLISKAVPVLAEKDDIDEKHSCLRMNGREIYKFASGIVGQCIDRLLEDTKMTSEQVDHFVLHQANSRIIDAIVKKLDENPEKFHKNLEYFGNTSSASIPILLDELVKANKIKDGETVLLAGFGGGLTWGSLLMKW